jgi:hypothetical protein
MNRIFAACSLTLLLSACGQDNTNTQNTEVVDVEVVNPGGEKHSGLLLERRT